MQNFKDGWWSFWNGLRYEVSIPKWFGWVVGFWVLESLCNISYEILKWILGLK